MYANTAPDRLPVFQQDNTKNLLERKPWNSEATLKIDKKNHCKKTHCIKMTPQILLRGWVNEKILRSRAELPFHSEPSASEYGLNSPSPSHHNYKTQRVCHISIRPLSFSSLIQYAIFSRDKTRGGECACCIVIDFSLNTLFITFNTFSHAYSVD